MLTHTNAFGIADAVLTTGDIVEVGPGYRGSGTWQSDGFEGIYTVIKRLPGQSYPGSAGNDYKLARGRHADLTGVGWNVIVHETRLRRA